MVPVMASTIDVNCLPDVSSKAISKLEGDYRRYRGVTDYDAGHVIGVPADVVSGFDYFFEHEAL